MSLKGRPHEGGSSPSGECRVWWQAPGDCELTDQADVAATGLEGGVYDLVTTCLVDEHLADLQPLYREVSRLARAGGLHVLVGFHPHFIMSTGMPTHFDRRPGEPVDDRDVHRPSQ